MAGRVVARRSGEGKAYWMLNSLYEVKVAGADTGGALTVVDMTIPKGWGPPPHSHPGDEVVHVLEGTVRYTIDGDEYVAGPGATFSIPEGTVESFAPESDVLRVLAVYRPGGIDEFFAEAGEPAQRHELPPLSQEPPDLERIAAIGEKHGMSIQVPEP